MPFQKGQSGNPAGKKPGTKSKTTVILREAILQAADEVGQDGKGKGGTVAYLKKQATENPVAFLGLLGKVLPMQVTGADDKELTVTLKAPWRTKKRT